MKKYLYMLGKKYLLIIGFLLFILPSCKDDILNEVPLDFLSPDNAYLTEKGVIQGISGLHERVRGAYYAMNEFGTMNWATHGSDLGYNGEVPQAGSGYLNSYLDLNPTFKADTAHWNVAYRIIQRANVLIKEVSKLDPTVFDDGEAGKNLYLGEAKFFRAFAYRNLVSTYGDVPLLTEPVSTAKDDFVRTPAAEVRSQMEADFKFAAENLPEPGKEAAPGRITQGPAWHFLAETYLEEKEYQKAVDAATKVVDGYHYALMTKRFGVNLAKDVFGSGDVYYDLFSRGNQNLAENTEAMWVIQVEPLITGGSQLATAYIFGPRYFDLALTPDGKKATLGTIYNGTYTGINDTLSRPTANARGTDFVFYGMWASDWNNDIRNAKHNIKRTYYFDNPASAYNGQKIDFSLYTNPPRSNLMVDTCKILFPSFIKFFDPQHYILQPNRAGSGITHKDWCALRFAETLLLRAEAYLDLNKPDLAAADINQIRNRANATPVKAADVTIDYILDERARELFGEEWRLIALRRTGKLVERVKKYNNNPACPGAYIQDFNVLWPIPQAQIDLNVGAPFAQNPGY
ncbi:MAG: RagB/SusD family nutrient uptake outer membrane protein [Bacteroidales bacterium]|nr:RagB/SusD family nutrient uptake outer membrane protein [Bacteroidales bacterium]